MRFLRELLSKHTKATTMIAAAVAVPIIALGYWLGSPLFIDRTLDEEFPFAAGAVVPTGMTRAEVDSAMETMSKLDDEMQEAMPLEMTRATVIADGPFQDVDSFHKGSGWAKIYRLPDGSHVLRLEDFRVTNGPDLRVILSPHPNPTGRGDVTATGYLELAKLKGNVGNQNYPLPEGIDPGAFNSVVIYCKPFHVLFSTARLESA